MKVYKWNIKECRIDFLRLDHSCNKYCNLIGPQQVSESHKVQRGGGRREGERGGERWREKERMREGEREIEGWVYKRDRERERKRER